MRNFKNVKFVGVNQSLLGASKIKLIGNYEHCSFQNIDITICLEDDEFSLKDCSFTGCKYIFTSSDPNSNYVDQCTKFAEKMGYIS